MPFLTQVNDFKSKLIKNSLALKSHSKEATRTPKRTFNLYIRSERIFRVFFTNMYLFTLKLMQIGGTYNFWWHAIRQCQTENLIWWKKKSWLWFFSSFFILLVRIRLLIRLIRGHSKITSCLKRKGREFCDNLRFYQRKTAKFNLMRVKNWVICVTKFLNCPLTVQKFYNFRI